MFNTISVINCGVVISRLTFDPVMFTMCHLRLKDAVKRPTRKSSVSSVIVQATGFIVMTTMPTKQGILGVPVVDQDGLSHAGRTM